MAWSGSGLYVSTFMDIFDTTQLGLDFDAEDHKMALYTNSNTPDYTNDTAYSSTNEVTGTAYTAGGKVLTGTAMSKASGNLTWDCDNVSWTSSTIASIRGAKIYADALGGNNLIMGIDFGQDYGTSDGTLLVAVNSSGLFVLDLVP